MHLYLSGILPCNSGEGFDGESAEGGEHGPAAVDELALTEPLQPEDFGVGLERGGGHVSGFGTGTNNISRNILGQVLVQPIVVVLQVLRGFAQTERVEAVVTDQAPVEPFRGLGARVPERAVRESGPGRLLGSFLGPESESGLDAARVGVHVGDAGSDKGGCSGGSCGSGHGFWANVRRGVVELDWICFGNGGIRFIKV